MNQDEMNERLLWDWIENAWKTTPEGEEVRASILRGEVKDIDLATWPMRETLERWLTRMTTPEGFVLFAKEFERKMFALDREDLTLHVGGGSYESIDTRGFTVLMGEAYCTRVLRDVSTALRGVGSEQAYMTLIRVYETRFHAPYPGFLRVTPGSNLDAWPTRRANAERKASIDAAVDALMVGLRLAPGPAPTLSGEPLVIAVPHLDPADMREAVRRLDDRLDQHPPWR